MKTKKTTRTSAPRQTHRAFAFAALLLFLLSLLYAGTDTRLKTVSYSLRDRRIQNEVRFVMLSDLHRSVYGKDQRDLIAAVEDASPDAVFLCGDVFDEHGEYEKAEPLLRALGARWPCYFVSGNHEFSVKTTNAQRTAFTQILKDCGIVWLASEKTTLTVGKTQIDLFGIEDESRYLAYFPEDGARFRDGSFYADLHALSQSVDEGVYSLLLCHRPLAEEVRACRFDLVLSGHVHGGQWRFPPLINGLYAPNQGFFPDYAGGMYTQLDGSCLIVGRGLSKTGIVPRFCNRPEVVVIDLLPGETQSG